jgi:hypothetical protein
MFESDADKLPCGRRTASGIAFSERLLEYLPDACAIGRQNRRRFGNCGDKPIPLHKTELGNHFCAFVNHYPKKSTASIADDSCERCSAGKRRSARQTIHDRFLRKLSALGADSKCKPLRKRKSTAYSGERSGARPDNYAVESAESKAMLSKEITHLHGPICAAGVSAFENPLENAAVRRQSNGLRVCGTVYGKQVH